MITPSQQKSWLRLWSIKAYMRENNTGTTKFNNRSWCPASPLVTRLSVWSVTREMKAPGPLNDEIDERDRRTKHWHQRHRRCRECIPGNLVSRRYKKKFEKITIVISWKIMPAVFLNLRRCSVRLCRVNASARGYCCGVRDTTRPKCCWEITTRSLAIAKRPCDCCIILKSGSYTKAI